MKLIDKADTMAEIEKLYNGEIDTYTRNILDRLKSNIDPLELKEVDLEKEVDIWRHNHFHGRRDKDASGEYLKRSSQLDLAKHFFELGLKVQKGE